MRLDPRDMVWKRGSFTVPFDVSEERVQLVMHRYIRRFGEALEAQGYTVLDMKDPVPDKGAALVFTTPDRKQYVMWALVTRAPFITHYEVPDEQVPMMLKQGFKVS